MRKFTSLISLAVCISLLSGACQQGSTGLNPLAVGATGERTASGSKEGADPSDDAGWDGDTGRTGETGSSNHSGAGAASAGAGSEGTSTAIARRIDPVSASTDSSDIWCPPSPDIDCRERLRRMRLAQDAVSNDPRVDQATPISQSVRVISLPEDVVARHALASDADVLQRLTEGSLPTEALQSATVQDSVVAAHPDGTLDLAPVLKPGLNLVFLDAGGASANGAPDAVSTVKSERFSYMGPARLSASQVQSLRSQVLKDVRLNEIR